MTLGLLSHISQYTSFIVSSHEIWLPVVGDGEHPVQPVWMLVKSAGFVFSILFTSLFLLSSSD
jgi:hypothetical protein